MGEGEYRGWWNDELYGINDDIKIIKRQWPHWLDLDVRMDESTRKAHESFRRIPADKSRPTLSCRDRVKRPGFVSI